MPAHRNGPRRTAHLDANEGARAEGSPDPLARFFSPAAGLDPTAELARNFEAVAQCAAILVRGIQDLAREWLGLEQDRFQRNLEQINALAHCRSVQDLLAAQIHLMRDNLDSTINNGCRIAELSVQVVRKATETVAQAERQSAAPADRARRAA